MKTIIMAKTIDKCIELIKDEISCYEFDIQWHKTNRSGLQYTKDLVAKSENELEVLQSHLNNLNLIKVQYNNAVFLKEQK